MGDLTDSKGADGTPIATDEVRPVASLFADVVGSTSLGERLSASEIKALIGDCVGRMCEAVEAYGGSVGAYMGDGIAAFFGIEATREDDAERAARAALEIKRVVGEYAREVEEAFGISEFNVRVGINTGRVGVGIVGAANPQLLALGDAVNVAARLQSAARPGTILVGAAAIGALAGRFSLRSLGPVVIRGRHEAVDAYEVEGLDAQRKREFPAPFVGRQSELETLSVLLGDLSTGRGQVCIVVGDAGLGKTRLVLETKRRAPSDVLWLDGQCDRVDYRLPFEPFVHLLRAWLGVDDGSTAIEARVRLMAKGRELLRERFEDYGPHLARLLGVSLGPRLDRRLEGLPADVLTAGLLTAYQAWVRALSDGAPVVLALDNFDLATSACSELGDALLAVVEAAPVLLLLTMRYRPGAPGWATRVRAHNEFAHRTTEIRLRSLGSDEGFSLVHELDAENVLDERLRGLVVDRAEGNPLYLEELFAAVACDPSDETSRALTVLPGQLEMLLLARIDALPERSRSVLQAAAVLGRVFARGVLGNMELSVDIDDSLAELLRADVIRENGRDPASYAFRHGLIREAALSTLTPERSRALNADAAQALSSWSGFKEERDAEALARYYVGAGQSASAVERLETVADRMAALYRYEEAGELYQRCVDELHGSDTPDHFIRIATKHSTALVMRGQSERALQLLEEARAVADAPSDRVDLLLAKVEHLAKLRDYPSLASAIEELSDLSLDGVQASRLLVLRGQMALARQDFESAIAACDTLEESGELPLEVAFEAASLRAGALATRGDFEDAEAWALRAQSIADRIGKISTQLAARRHVALICLLKGAVREAFGLLTYAYQAYAELEFVQGQLEAGTNLVHVAHLVGELDAAVEVGVRLLRQEPGPVWTSMLKSNLAVVRFEQDRADEARTLAEEVLDMVDLVVTWPRTSAHLLLANLALSAGRFAEAEAELETARADAMLPGREAERAMVETTLAEVAYATGRHSEALRYAVDARSRLESSERVAVVHVERILATVSGERSPVESLESLLRTLDLTRRMGLRLEEARTLVALGAFDDQGAMDHFDEAQRIFERCGCRRGLVELDEARAAALARTAK